MKTIKVHELPACDFCGEPAPYDDKTTKGPWANMCESHQRQYGFQIGSKRELIVKTGAKRSFDTVPVVVVPLNIDEGVPQEILDIMEIDAMPDSIQEVLCPWCDEPKRVEIDANYLVTCESCEKPYRLVSQV